MGCSSSAQTQVKESIRPASKSPDANGLQKCDDSLPTTEENDKISDQTKLIPTEETELGSHGTKLSEGFAKEESEVLIPEITGCNLSICQRVDPEGTEPQPLAPEETFDSSGPLSIPLLEAGEPLPVEPSKDIIHEPQDINEAVNCLFPETLQDNMPESVASSQQDTPEPLPEDCADLVTEMVKELQLSEEELQTEDNKCLATDTEGETGEKMETEMHQETVSEGSETKEEEIGEDTAAATEETEANSEE